MTIREQCEVLEGLGRRIIQFRQRKKWRRAELARRLGVSRERLGHWERGENTPPLEALLVLGRELGVSLDELVAGEPVPENGLSHEKKDQARLLVTALARLLGLSGEVKRAAVPKEKKP